MLVDGTGDIMRRDEILRRFPGVLSRAAGSACFNALFSESVQFRQRTGVTVWGTEVRDAVARHLRGTLDASGRKQVVFSLTQLFGDPAREEEIIGVLRGHLSYETDPDLSARLRWIVQELDRGVRDSQALNHALYAAEWGGG